MIGMADAPIFGVDRLGNATEWNQKAAQLFGFSANETAVALWLIISSRRISGSGFGVP